MPSTRCTPSRPVSSSTIAAGTVLVSAPVNPPAAAAADVAGRTVMSGAVCRNSSVKLLFRVSVKTKVPATNATPRTMAKALIPIRSLWASRLFRVARNISGHRGRVRGSVRVETLHPVEHPFGRRLEHLVDDPAVRQEQHPVGVAGGIGVVRHHDDGLAEIPHRALQEAQHLGAGYRIQVAGRLVGEHDV